MRQQEANQFDKGLNLDTNPIAMDNHQLTGALNATMITMNGNELVLQNDMGNGRVDQAQLPEGYVPVGMKEYGGIVYVASYNPIKGESQIGCFPSPQRNIPSTENNSNTQLQFISDFISNEGSVENPNYFIKTLSKKDLLIGSQDIVRTGDKFIITATESDIKHYEEWSNFIKLRVIVVNDDGSSIDITDDLTIVRPGSVVPFLKSVNDLSDISGIVDRDYSIYKNKISGKIYLESQLIVPSYINTQITASKDNNEVTVIITPTSYDTSDGETEIPWTFNKHSYALNYKVNGRYPQNVELPLILSDDTEFKISNLSENDTLWYELYPTYQYEKDDNNNFIGPAGKVESLKRENTIEINDIGTGEVKFSTFRYYNDVANETFQFDYGLNAYIEGFDGNNHTLNSVYIEAFDVDDILTVNGDISAYTENLVDEHQKKIQLGTTNYFGVYTKMISYGADTLEMGKHYIARLCALVSPIGSDRDILTKGKWYSIITSSVTNKLYIKNTDNMIKIQTDDYPEGGSFKRHVFEFDWEADFNREEINENIYESVDSKSNIKGILTTPPTGTMSNQRIKYETLKEGYKKYRHTATVTVPQSRNVNDLNGGHIKFPYNMEAPVNLSFTNFTANTDIQTSGELTDQLVNNINYDGTNYIMPSSTPIQIERANQTWYIKDSNDLTFHYKLWSQFFEKLLKNPNYSGESVDDYKFTLDTQMAAFVPYLPAFDIPGYSQPQLEKILGPLESVELDEAAEGYAPMFTQVKTKYWLSYMLHTSTYEHPGSSDKRVGIISGEYGDTNWDPEDYDGWNEIINEDCTGKDSYRRWNLLSPQIADKMRNLCGFTPAILIWCGADGVYSCGLYPYEKNYGDTDYGGLYKYSIVMFLDQTGNYHVINQYGKNYFEIMNDIVQSFQNIYVCQPNQQVEFNYWQGDINNYVYTKNYQLNISYKANITINSDTTPIIDSSYGAYNNLDDNHSEFTFNDVNIQLPKIKLIAGVKEKQYSDIYFSPDQSIKVSQFLTQSDSPTFDTCAVILDKYGRHIIMNAYEHHSANDYSPTPFNPGHVYIKSICSRDYQLGETTKLLDIQDYQNILPQDEIGFGSGLIAQAIRDGKIKMTSSLDNDAKILVIVPSRCGNKLTNHNNGWWLGESYDSGNVDRSSRRKLSDLCGGFVNIELINGDKSSGDGNKIRKLSEPWNTTVYNS